MPTKNIFYSSNSYSNIYPNNARSNFVTQIDENEFHYIKPNNISAAVKTITFENRFNSFRSDYGRPNLILIQENNTQLLRYEALYDSPGNIDIQSGKDYYFLSDNPKVYGEGKNFDLRNFTDIKLFCTVKNSLARSGFINNFIIHNIYFHETDFKSGKELISYLNYVFLNIEFDSTEKVKKKDKSSIFRLHEDNCTSFINKNNMPIHIYLSNELSQILGFDEKDLEYLSLSSLRGLIVNHFKGIRINDGPAYFPEELQSFSENGLVNAFLDMTFKQDFVYSRNFHDDGSISIKSSKEINLISSGPEILGLRTNLSKPDLFKNCTYDTQVEFINVKDHPGGIQIFTVKQPSFFETTLEKIANAKFELIDVETGKIPNFSVGTPTYIQLHVSNNSSMSRRFNIFLDSSDKISQHYFPSNTPFDFTIKLPERLEFDKQWEIALKNIFIGNDLFNIYKDSCWIKINILKTEGQIDLSGNTWHDPNDVNIVEAHIPMEDGKYKSIEDICSYLQRLFERLKLNLKIDLADGHVRIRCSEERTNLRDYTLRISPYLSNILGIDRSTNNENKIHFDNKKKFIASYKPNIVLLVPTNFIILCDVVSETVFGSKTVKILKLLSTNFDPKNEIIQFSFYQDEFVDLTIKEFSSIRIQIVDATGNHIKSGQAYPTRCQIHFLKKLM